MSLPQYYHDLLNNFLSNKTVWEKDFKQFIFQPERANYDSLIQSSCGYQLDDIKKRYKELLDRFVKGEPGYRYMNDTQRRCSIMFNKNWRSDKSCEFAIITNGNSDCGQYENICKSFAMNGSLYNKMRKYEYFVFKILAAAYSSGINTSQSNIHADMSSQIINSIILEALENTKEDKSDYIEISLAKVLETCRKFAVTKGLAIPQSEEGKWVELIRLKIVDGGYQKSDGR
jgi:hypothetical protein